MNRFGIAHHDEMVVALEHTLGCGIEFHAAIVTANGEDDNAKVAPELEIAKRLAGEDAIDGHAYLFDANV
jgi:hypothetical protein